MKKLAQLVSDIRAKTHGQRMISPQTLLACLDLTALNESDTPESISVICEQAMQYSVACVCVSPQFVNQVYQAFQESQRECPTIATVANFPTGNEPFEKISQTIQQAIEKGATELDIVLPYRSFLAKKNVGQISDFVHQCRESLPRQKLKIIMETCAFGDLGLLEQAAFACLEAGADFLKTSTGKESGGADLLSSAVLLQAIADFGDAHRGFKASGGIKTYAQAQEYFLLAQTIFQQKILNKQRFRIGASSLLSELVKMAIDE